MDGRLGSPRERRDLIIEAVAFATGAVVVAYWLAADERRNATMSTSTSAVGPGQTGAITPAVKRMQD